MIQSKVGDIRRADKLPEADGYILTQNDMDIAISLGWDQKGDLPLDTPASALLHTVRDNYGDTVDYDEVWVSDHVAVALNTQFQRVR